MDFPLVSLLINLSISLKEEWDVKEEDSPAVFIEVSLEVKQEYADDSSVFHQVDGECTTNYSKVIIHSIDLLLNFLQFNEYLGKIVEETLTEIYIFSIYSVLKHNYHFLWNKLNFKMSSIFISFL